MNRRKECGPNGLFLQQCSRPGNTGLIPFRSWRAGKCFQWKGEKGVLVSRTIHEALCVPECFYLKFRPATQVFLLELTIFCPAPHPTHKREPLLALNTHLDLDWNWAALRHCRNYVGQGLCFWQRKHSSNSTWVILNESLYLVINFIIIQPLPLTPKFISQSKLAKIH